MYCVFILCFQMLHLTNLKELYLLGYWVENVSTNAIVHFQIFNTTVMWQVCPPSCPTGKPLDCIGFNWLKQVSCGGWISSYLWCFKKEKNDYILCFFSSMNCSVGLLKTPVYLRQYSNSHTKSCLDNLLWCGRSKLNNGRKLFTAGAREHCFSVINVIIS